MFPAGGSVLSSSFSARVVVSGFRLVASKPRGGARQGFGHLHFILDHGRYDEPKYAGRNGLLALRMGVNGFYSPAYAPTTTYAHIPPGWHTLTVELVNNDDSSTGVSATLRFRVR